MRLTALFAAAALGMIGTCVALASPPNDVAKARSVLEAARRAYQAVPALRDTLTYTLDAPNADHDAKRIEIRLGPGRDVFVGDALFQAFAVGDSFYVTKTGASDKYVLRPYAGNFRETLATIVGSESSLFEPPEVAMRMGEDLDQCIDAFRFHQLTAVRIVGYRAVTDPDGRGFDEIQLAAGNGQVDVRLDATTHFFSSLRLQFHPQGAPDSVHIEIHATFSPVVLPSSQGQIAFDARGRRAVAALADLESESPAVGKPAPSFDLETAAGQRVTLAGLEGRVVVIDLWASWCAPCWKTLGEAQKLSAWAASRSLPVAVLSLNTLEKFPSEQERKTRVTALFKARGFTLPILLDRGSEISQGFGSPGLPSTIVIGSQGKTLHVYQGLLPNLFETLRQDIEDALLRR